MSLDERLVKIDDLQLVGDDTRFVLSGSVGLRDERMALRAVGDANLGILQGFFRDVRGSGRAELTAAIDGPLREPVFSGRATISGGRVRHFSLPNSLDAINGAIQFDARRHSARRADRHDGRWNGAVRRPNRVRGVRAGRAERDRPRRRRAVAISQGVRSVIDADLALRGNYQAPTLAGIVTVKSAVYSRRIDEPDLLELVARRAGDSGAEAGPAAPAAAAVPLKFDIEIMVPSTLRIDNNLARLRANADLFLRGTYDRPTWFGHAEVERGEVLLLGRRYRVTRGTIDLINPTKFEPLFDVELETNVRVPGQTYRVTVSAVGTAAGERLGLTFASDPPLPAIRRVGVALQRHTARHRTRGRRAPRAPESAAEHHGHSVDARDAAAGQSRLLEVGRVVEQTFGVDTFQLTPIVHRSGSAGLPYQCRPRVSPSASASRTAYTSRFPEAWRLRSAIRFFCSNTTPANACRGFCRATRTRRTHSNSV